MMEENVNYAQVEKQSAEEMLNEMLNVPDLEEVLVLAEKEAASKGLNVFIFKKEDLEKYFTVRSEKFVVVTVGRNMDTAVWNLRNFRHSYLAKEPVSIEQV